MTAPSRVAFRSQAIPARFEVFALANAPTMDALVVVPTVRGTRWLKYGEHAYYFMDFAARRGICVCIRHADIIGPGFSRFRRAAAGTGVLAWLRCLLRPYHYGFSFLEEIMLMTVPHTVTDLEDGTFMVNLWAYFGYLLIDPRKQTVVYQLLDGDADTVLGANQWYDARTSDTRFLAYPLAQSFARIANPVCEVPSSIMCRPRGSAAAHAVWSGPPADFLHDYAMSADRAYWAVCELGMYRQNEAAMLPSRVLVGENHTAGGRVWRLDDIDVAAHAEFDPENGRILYLSSHNFQFEHTPLFKLLRQATYTVRFNGPAAILKYGIDPESGPREMGRFSRDDFKRLTNMHVFRSGGRKLIVAMGFPDELHVVDAESMTLLRKITVREPADAGVGAARAVIGTMAPSVDGAHLFVQTTRSFQVLSMTEDAVEYVWHNGRHHACTNHMYATRGAV